MALIEREALLGRLRSHYNRIAGGGTIYTPSMMLAITDAERAPAIEAAPVVHGRWVTRNDSPHGQKRKYCSACGEHSGLIKERPYCPNCGARMDGGNDDG